MHTKNICFSGGGTRGIVYIGALNYLYSHGHMHEVKGFAGTSVGAIFAFMCACGLTFSKISEMFLSFDFSSVVTSGISSFLHGAERMYQSFGWYSHEGLEQLVKSICIVAFDEPDITFSRLYELTGRDLVICATDIETVRSVYFSHVMNPDMSVVSAVVASASIPLFFQPYIIDGRPFVDGGVLNNFPMNYFINQEEKEETLGLLINAPDDSNGDECMKSFVNYSGRLVFAMLSKIQNLQISRMDTDNIITLTVSGVSPTDFTITDEQRDRIVKDGYIMTETYFRRRQSLAQSLAPAFVSNWKTALLRIAYKYKMFRFLK